MPSARSLHVKNKHGNVTEDAAAAGETEEVRIMRLLCIRLNRLIRYIQLLHTTLQYQLIKLVVPCNIQVEDDLADERPSVPTGREEEREDAAADPDDSVRSAASTGGGGGGKAACQECDKEFASKQVERQTK